MPEKVTSLNGLKVTLEYGSLSGLFLKVRFVAKLKCPHVGYVLAFAKDFLASCLELLQGFQHV
ncbi:hypothetical protein, partial [Klebsiella quasipneumoniae]|uniref:hypothetical protein n=1 Tax=Klebsiella quasipneumoniae TaxID=1463165 RepID=UPI002B05ADA7